MARFVVPGERLTELVEKRSGHKERIVLGPGLQRRGGQLHCSSAGRLQMSRNPDRYWVDSVQSRYRPVQGERVLGVVLSNRGNQVKVDIGTPEYALLNMFAFEGATKKNRPDIKVSAAPSSCSRRRESGRHSPGIYFAGIHSTHSSGRRRRSSSHGNHRIEKTLILSYSQVGDLVYARLLVAGKDVESELVCVTSKGKKEGLGILPAGGYLFQVPVHVVRR